MSWGDHDTEAINEKLNVKGRLKAEQSTKISKEQELYFVHKADNENRNLAYRDRDWFGLGWDEAIKNAIPSKSTHSYKNNFSRNLKIIRVAFGFTMEELHNQSGVAVQTIGKYEQGDTEPTISTLIKLAEALNVSIGYLVNAELKLKVEEI